jgi:hypothetical protein
LVAPTGGVHVWQVEPHDVTDSVTQALPHRTKPGLQVKVQVGAAPPTDMHWAIAFAGTVHGEQLLPQLATSKFETQSPPHWWKPCAQVEPQSVPSQVAVPLGGTGHAVHRIPHDMASKFETHWFPHL